MSVSVRAVSGPTFAPAGRAGIGLLSATCMQYTWEPAAAGSARAWVMSLDHVIAAGDVLEYDIMPAFGDFASVSTTDARVAESGFAATAACLDLALSDGSRAFEQRVVDHHGVDQHPKSVFDSKTLTVDQWNRISIELDSFVDERIVGVEIRVLPSARRFSGWIDGPRIVARQLEEPDGVDSVSALRGSNSSALRSRGNTVPAVALPQSFHLLIPVTDSTNPSWPYSYQANVDADGTPVLEAFAVSHSVTPWLGDRGVLHFFPLAQDTVEAEDPVRRRRRFQRRNESARPHEYRVRFDDGTCVLLAPGQRAGMIEIHSPFPAPRLLVTFPDPTSALEATATPNTFLQGWSDQAGALPDGSTRCFFALQSDARVNGFEMRKAPNGADTVVVTFDLPAGAPLTIRVGSSFLSSKQAEENIAQSAPPSSSAESLAADARLTWGELLNRFHIAGATPDQRVSFYSSLYRLFLYPSDAHERDSEGRNRHSPTGKRIGLEATNGPLVVGNGFWDTYRTVWPAYALLAPERTAELIDGFVQHFRETGWVPRWSAPGAVDLMVGTSSDIAFADADAKGVPTIDGPTTFASAVKNATVPSPDPRTGRKGQGASMYRGYVDLSVDEGLSWSLENGICDAAIARFAARLAADAPGGSPETRDLSAMSQYLSHRSLDYRLLFDSSSGFFRGRDNAGRFSAADFDPRDWGGDYTETNAWGMAFSAPHDPIGLRALHGGPAGLEAKLDCFFSLPETASSDHVGAYGRVIHEMPCRRPRETAQ